TLVGPNSWLGIWAKQFGVEIVFHEPAIVLAMLFVTFPFVIRTLQPLLEELDPAEEEASFTMGASPAMTFRRVIFPSILPGILSGALLVFSRALAEFGAVVLVAGNLPGKTLVAAVYVFGQIESDNPLGAAAISTLLLTISLLLLWGTNHLQAKRVAK
ncbi:MAG: ABC transporter permease, partial [Tumebacillaceae bacterium]